MSTDRNCHYCGIWIQNTQEVKENAFSLDKTGQNVRIFEEVLSFQATYNIKTEKQTINSLRLCQFDAGMLAEGLCVCCVCVCVSVCVCVCVCTCACVHARKMWNLVGFSQNVRTEAQRVDRPMSGLVSAAAIFML